MSKYQDREWLQKQAEAGVSMAEVARKTGVTQSTITRWKNRFDIKFKKDHVVHEKPSREELKRLCDTHSSQQSIADHFNITRKPVQRWLDEEDLAVNPMPNELDDEDALREMYYEQRMTSTEVGDEIGCAGSTVLSALRRHDIEVRSKGGSSSGSCRALNQCFDSLWERNVAAALEHLGTDWAYEPKTVETPFGEYTPDFIVKDVVIEVKGSPRMDKKPPKFMHMLEEGVPILLVGTDYWAEMMPHSDFIEYDDRDGLDLNELTTAIHGRV